MGSLEYKTNFVFVLQTVLLFVKVLITQNSKQPEGTIVETVLKLLSFTLTQQTYVGRNICFSGLRPCSLRGFVLRELVDRSSVCPSVRPYACHPPVCPFWSVYSPVAFYSYLVFNDSINRNFRFLFSFCIFFLYLSVCSVSYYFPEFNKRKITFSSIIAAENNLLWNVLMRTSVTVSPSNMSLKAFLKRTVSQKTEVTKTFTNTAVELFHNPLPLLMDDWAFVNHCHFWKCRKICL